MIIPKLPDTVLAFIQKIENSGFQAYAVGGCVRDLLMQRKTHDWDFTTSAKPEDILKIFPEHSFYNNRFGTVGIVTKVDNKEELYQITTYRSESDYTDKRRPDTVKWGLSITDDLSRRDFTVNAIAVNTKEIIDPYQGQQDIQNKCIRAVGNPEKRFTEDALRLIRAVRLSSELGFLIEDQTAKAITVHAQDIEFVSKERVRDELFRILESSHPADGILLLKNTGLLHYIIPEFDTAFQTPQKSPKRHHIYDVGTHSIEALRNCPSPDPLVRLAALLHDIGKPSTYAKTADGVITFFNHEVIGTTMVRNIAVRLKFSRKDTGRIIKLVRWHGFTVEEHQTDKALRRFIRRVGKENIHDILDLRTGDRLGGGATETSWRLELFKKRLEEVQLQPFSITDLKVNGNDVMKELEIKPGPNVGKILQTLFDKVEEGTLPNEREALLQEIRSKK